MKTAYIPIWTMCKRIAAMVTALMPAAAPKIVYADSDAPVEKPSQDVQQTPDATAARFIPRAITDIVSEAPYIESYNVAANVVGTQVQIETEVTIRNPGAQPYGGKLELPIPDNAVITGYAIDITTIDIHHQMIEAEVVSRDYIDFYTKGMKIYDEPSLNKPNVFKSDIDSILPRGYRKVRITYIMPLQIAADDTASVVLPVSKQTLLSRKVSISVNIPGIEKPSLNTYFGNKITKEDDIWKLDWVDNHITPDQDIILSIPALPHNIIHFSERDSQSTQERFFMATMKVEKAAETERDLSRVRVIWDASGSRFAEDIHKSLEVLKQLQPDASYELHILRNKLEAAQHFNSLAALVQYIEKIPYDGSTNYDELKTIAQTAFKGTTLIFTDGLDTYHHDLPEFGMQSAAVLAGEYYNTNTLWQATHGHIVDLNKLSAKEAIAEIRSPKPKVFNVTNNLDGGSISKVQGLRNPAEGWITVIGKSHLNDLRIMLSDGREYQIKLSDNVLETGLIAKSWAVQRVAELSGDSAKYEEELIEIGKHYGVASPVTKMVLLQQNNVKKKRKGKKKTSTEENFERALDKIADDITFSGEIYELWVERANWWSDPIPKDIVESYQCSPKNKKQCTRTVSSELGEHYTVPFKPPKNWTCNELINCYATLEPIYGPALYGPGVTMSLTPKALYGPAPARFKSPSELYIGTPGRKYSKTDSTFNDISVDRQDWDPESPCLKALKALRSKGANADALYTEYLNWKSKYANSSAFYFEVADYFFSQKMNAYGLRILTNLLEFWKDRELIMETYIRRLTNADELDEALHAIQVIMPREEDRARFEVARVYDMRARKTINSNDAQQALNLYHQVYQDAVKNQYGSETVLDALEAFQSLVIWVNAQKWKTNKPVVPKIDDAFDKTFDTDLRIVLEWDGENKYGEDVQDRIVITEPTTEKLEKLQRHHERSVKGGLLDGRQYLIKQAEKGEYKVSIYRPEQLHDQDVLGSETIRAIIYRNWGRPNQTQEIIVKPLQSIHPYKATSTDNTAEDEAPININDIPIDQIAVIRVK